MLNKLKDFLYSERGDTNIISVLLIMCVVIALAIIVKDMVEGGMERVRNWFETFLNTIVNWSF